MGGVRAESEEQQQQPQNELTQVASSLRIKRRYGSDVDNDNDYENHQYNDDEYVDANEDVATNEIGEYDGIDGMVADVIGQDIGAHEGMVADDEPFAPRVRITRQRTLWGGYWKRTETTTANGKIIIQHLLHTNQTFPNNLTGHNPDSRPSDIPKA